MGSRGAADVAERMIGDAAFRAAVRRDPLGALAGYDVSDEEKLALAAAADTAAIGVDARVTKGRTFSDRAAKMRWSPAAARMAADPTFRDAVRANPTAALAAAGGTPSIGLHARVTKGRSLSDRAAKMRWSPAAE